MAYVLAAIALLGIVPLVNGIVRDEISQKYNLDLDTQDYEVWQENWDAYEAECQSDTAANILGTTSIILFYLSIACIYVGVFLFFLLLKKNMSKGSRLTPTIILGLVSPILCVVFLLLGRYTSISFWCAETTWRNILYIVSALMLFATFATMTRFLPHGTVRLSGIILTLIIVVYWVQHLFYFIEGIMGLVLPAIIYPLAFAFFYFEFSKLKK